MKKILLLTMGVGCAFGSFGQRIAAGKVVAPQGTITNFRFNIPGAGTRTTGIGSVDTLLNLSLADTPVYYLAGLSDSGYVSGTDIYGDMGYAERYDFNASDSSLKVLGVVTLFGGTVNPLSTKTATFYTWDVGAQFMVATNVYESGYPNNALDSVTVPFNHLGVPASDTLEDTFKIFMFTTPTAYLTSSFFVGYTINYNFSTLNGDTIALYTSQDGLRTSPIYTLSGVDTIINNQNVTMYSDGSWNDNATSNFQIQNDLYIFPIVQVGNGTAGVKSVNGSGFTLLGNYPNPAVNSTDIKFSLASSTDVTVYIMNMNGQVLQTVSQAGLAEGTHSIPVSTADMASGNYLYLVHTQGGGMAGTFTVAH